jgi:aminoglycoside phosphotransferase (APT) family kinase protein
LARASLPLSYMTAGLDSTKMTARVPEVLRGLGGLSGIRELVPVPGGHSHQMWRASTEGGDVLVKIPLRHPKLALVRRHMLMHRSGWLGGAQLAELLHVMEHSPLGRPLLVFRWLPGVDARQAWPILTPAQRRRVARGWGCAVAGLHAVRSAAFTGHSAEASWAEVVAERVETLVGAHSVAGVLDPGTAAAVGHRVCVAADEIAPLVQPVFTHLDLHLPNIIVRGGQFAGVLDCEHARWWDPAADAVKLTMWVFEPHPEIEEPFWEGYHSAGGQLVEFAHRQWVCAGLEWLSGLLYWPQVGDPAMFTDYQQRLAQWLQARPRLG